MGSDGILQIIYQKEINQFSMNIIKDAIYTLLKSQGSIVENDSYTIELYEDEEVIFKNINSSHYWDIYEYLNEKFNNSLNSEDIPGYALV
jgi:hypothetical protein